MPRTACRWLIAALSIAVGLSEPRADASLYSFYIKQHILCNIRCVIRKSLERASDRQEIKSRADVFRVFFHEADQLVIAKSTQVVHGVVRFEHITGQSNIICHKSIQAFTPTIACTRPPMSGMSITGRISGASINDRALWTMFTDKSPMRFKFVLIFRAAIRKRRLVAMGWWRASNSIASSSISSSIESIRVSSPEDLLRRAAIPERDRDDAALDSPFDKRTISRSLFFRCSNPSPSLVTFLRVA